LGGLRYLILGPLEVRKGETEVALRGGQQRKLLAILLLHAGEAVSADRLIEELWQGKPPGTAAKALQGYVSSLRKQLGQETVETVGAGYRLDVAAEQIDAGRFEELLAEARRLERAPAAARLREALALWRGQALADFAYDDFARHEIERLEELRLSCIERRIDLELALGHHDDLVAELDALVHTHPLRERLRGHLMVALYRAGRQAEALDAYQAARTALRDELGLEPSEDLQALQRAILDHDASLAAPQRVDLPPAPGTRHLSAGSRLRHPLAAITVGSAILLGAAAVFVLSLRGHNVSAIVVPPNSVARIDEKGKGVESFVGVGRGPTAIAVGAGGVWVANAEEGSVTRLDPATGKFVATIGTGADVSDIAVGFGSVWVADGNDGTVTQIDPRLNEQGQTITIPLAGQPALAPSPVFYVAVDSRYVWATRGDELVRIDPKTDEVDGHLTVGTPTGLTTGGGSVWVTTGSEFLLRIDRQTVEKTDSQLLAEGVGDPVYANGTVWLINQGEVQEIDPTTLGIVDTVQLKTGYPVALAAGTGAVWALAHGGRLLRITHNRRVTASLDVGKRVTAVAAGGGATWVAVSAAG
jgi:DNA-binding SARP family transcriptional activator/streptogramin lyase